MSPGRRSLAVLVGVLAASCRPVGAQEASPALSAEATPPIVVASKPFAESFLLAELFAQHLEARGLAVERRPGLGATEIAFEALRTGAIDVYPEYTGTGLTAVLGLQPEGGAREVFGRVSREFLSRFGVRWLPPLGFENSYAIAVRGTTADSLALRTLGDLAAVAPDLVGGFSPDFIGRPDGLPGVSARYGLDFGETRPLLQAVKYTALAEGAVDVIDGYRTDGAIDRYDLRVLADDRGFFPPYEAAAIVRPGLAEQRPEAIAALVELSGRLSAAQVRRANRRIEVEGVPVSDVAAGLREELGLIRSAARRIDRGDDASPAASREGLLAYLWSQRRAMLDQTLRHLWLVGASVGLAILLAVPAGVSLAARPRWAEPLVRATGTLQTLPSIALLAFMIPLLGIGVGPAVFALFLYALFPILRNTWSGVRDADPEAVDAARALGMTERQILLDVRLPLAAPMVMAGVRVSAVIAVGTATLAAFIGAGGLGDPIVAGLALSDERMILAGAIPAAVLALLVDAALGVVESAVRPRGLDQP